MNLTAVGARRCASKAAARVWSATRENYGITGSVVLGVPCSLLFAYILCVVTAMESVIDDEYHQVSAEPTDEHLTWTWWSLLVAAAAVNVGILIRILLTAKDMSPHARRLRMLVIPYVLVCAFRSCFINNYITRRAVVDHPLSNIALARGLAMVAEVSFACLVSSGLAAIHVDLGYPLGLRRPQYMVSLLTATAFSAQCFSNTCTVTRNNLFCAMENSHWVVLSAAWALWACMLHCHLPADAPPSVGWVLFIARVLGPVVVVFLLTVDVPTYVARWRMQDASSYQSLSDGAWEAATVVRATQDFALWKEEVAWMSGYFTFAVWGALALAAYAPRVPARSTRSTHTAAAAWRRGAAVAGGCGDNSPTGSSPTQAGCADWPAARCRKED